MNEENCDNMKNKEPWWRFYKGTTCQHTGCTSKARYVYLVGEGDIPVCSKHKKDAEKDFPHNRFVDMEVDTE